MVTEKQRKYRKEGRYNPKSVRNRRKKDLEQRRGKFFMDEKNWTHEEADKVCEIKLVLGWGDTHPDPERPSIHSVLGRTRDSANTKWRTLMIRRCTVKGSGGQEETFMDSKPVGRTDRTGWPLEFEDWHVFKRALSPRGRDLGANDPKHIARITGRSKSEVKKILEIMERPDLLRSVAGFFDPPKKVDSSRETYEVAEKIFKAAKKGLIHSLAKLIAAELKKGTK
jgi:hypothetical protein